jgi:hypothetical protein
LSKEKVKIRKIVSNDERLFSLSSITSPASRNEERKKCANLLGKRKSGGKKKSKDSTVDTGGDGGDSERIAEMEEGQDLF